MVKHKPEPLTDEEVKRILEASSKDMTKRGRRDHLILRLLIKIKNQIFNFYSPKIQCSISSLAQ